MSRGSGAAAGYGVTGVSVRLGRSRVLDAITWHVPPGAVHAVVGPDGAGKTTLLRTLVGTVAAFEGRIERPPAHLVGYVPADGGVYAGLTVDENLAFAASSYRVRGDLFRRRRDRLLDSSGLRGAADRRASALSGGMARKLAFAMAMIHDPALLVLDEPSTGLDPVSRSELWRLLAGAAAGGTAVALSSTYLDEAERAATVLVLESGFRVLAGPPAQITAAVTGSIRWSDRPGGSTAWRVGRRWKVWDPDGEPGGGDVAVTLEDAVIVSELAGPTVTDGRR